MNLLMVDIDDTIMTSTAEKCHSCGRFQYTNPVPNKEVINRINHIRAQGTVIILWTGRGWDMYQKTIEQIKAAGIDYDQLIMGKPSGIYFDATNAIKTLEEFDDRK